LQDDRGPFHRENEAQRWSGVRPTLRFVAVLWIVSVGTALAAGGNEPVQILVGQNILVSRDGDFPHLEYTIASDPAKANNFVAAAMTLSGPGRSIGVRIYRSDDGGNRWNFHHFPELERGIGSGSGDPQIAFGPAGTAYFSVLTDEFDAEGHEVPQRLYVYRSEDGGKTWLSPARLSTCDRPSMTVDLSTGKFRGRIYISALYTKDHQQTLGLFYSDDDGRSFIGPVDVVRASGAQVSPPLVLGDGTVVFPYVEWEMERGSTFESQHILKVVTSNDGGQTFSAPRQIAAQKVPGGTLVEDFRERLAARSSKARIPHLGGATFDWPTIPQFASNPRSKTFRDRIYTVWSDTEAESEQILFSYSVDHGNTWSKPAPISVVASHSNYQFQPMVSVNDDGVVGVEWFDSRNSRERDAYDLYFAASLDGGASFLTAKRVTSQSSLGSLVPHITPNLEDNAFRQDRFQLLFGSIESTRGMGDYMGLTADSAGAFHSVWADSRYGSFQMMTARIEVSRLPWKPTQSTRAASDHHLGGKDVSFVLDPIRYDSDKHELVIPVRLRNISGRDLLQPITVAVKSLELGFPPLAAAGFAPPRIVNAVNGKPGKGAVFDYSQATGDFPVLKAGQETEAVSWRFEMTDPGQALFSIQAEVRGGAP